MAGGGEMGGEIVVLTSDIIIQAVRIGEKRDQSAEGYYDDTGETGR